MTVLLLMILFRLQKKKYSWNRFRIKCHRNRKKIKKKPSMSFGTSFLLSLKNLITKKGRTALTSFAGSIGIIGIALVYAVSQGFTEYIDDVQENALSSYPLTIEKTNTDLSAITETFMGQTNDNADHENNAVYENSSMYNIVETFNNLDSTENDLKSFKSHIDSEYADNESELHKALNGVQYSYDLDLLVYTENVDGTIIPSDVSKLLTNLLMEYMNIDMTSMQNLRSNSSIMNLDNSPMSSMGGISVNVWQEMLSGDNGDPVNDILKKQYDVVYGTWPSKYDEVVLVLDENNELTILLYMLLDWNLKKKWVRSLPQLWTVQNWKKSHRRNGLMKKYAIWSLKRSLIPTATATMKKNRSVY